MSRGTHNSNLAASMGRWSAAHWKTATFGWLAFVVVAFGIGGVVGTKDTDPNTTGPGQSGRMDRILDAGFKQPAGESVLVQSRLASRDRSGVQSRHSGRRRARLEGGRRPQRPLAARFCECRPDRGRTGTRRSSSSRSAATRQGGRQGRARPRRPSPGPSALTRASSSASSATRARSRRSRPRTATIWPRRVLSRSRSR